jgi:hypothetical protein
MNMQRYSEELDAIMVQGSFEPSVEKERAVVALILEGGSSELQL